MEDTQVTLDDIKAIYDHKLVEKVYTDVLHSDQLHVGLYEKEKYTIDEAATAITAKMLKLLPKVNKSTRILELGSGRGTSARYIAEERGCKIDCFDLSPKHNEYNTKQNEKEPFDQLIKVQQGDIQDVMYDREAYDFVWAQETLMHCSDKHQVFRLVTRALKPEGRFIFTDIMKHDDAPDSDQLKTLEERAAVQLVSPSLYKRLARRHNLHTAYLREWPNHLDTHLKRIQDRINSTSGLSKLEAFHKMAREAFDAQGITWGLMIFQKINI